MSWHERTQRVPRAEPSAPGKLIKPSAVYFLPQPKHRESCKSIDERIHPRPPEAQPACFLWLQTSVGCKHTRTTNKSPCARKSLIIYHEAQLARVRHVRTLKITASGRKQSAVFGYDCCNVCRLSSHKFRSAMFHCPQTHNFLQLANYFVSSCI